MTYKTSRINITQECRNIAQKCRNIAQKYRIIAAESRPRSLRLKERNPNLIEDRLPTDSQFKTSLKIVAC
jgi:hypothetical protein